MAASGSPRQRTYHRTRRLFLLGLLIAAALCFAIPGVASAHAHLVQADPAPGAVIARAPAVASFVFDEELNPTLTRVRITDAAGHAVTANPGRLAAGHGGTLWRLPLPALKPGTYSVFWTSESATDGHVMSSFYTFRVAATGTAAHMGAAMGTGAMAGMSDGGQASAWGLHIDGGMAAITLFIWLGLMAQALWLGALVIELAVLAPARRATITPEARLAWLAATRVWQLARVAPFVVAASLAGQVLCLALEGTGGDWGRALAPATLGGILSSQNGKLMALRIVLLLVAIRLTGRTSVPVPASIPTPARFWPRPRRAPQTLGIMAPPIGLPRLDWESARVPVTILAAIYMLAAAFSGHAANVAPALLWQSCTIDWLHLVCTAAWAGGMAVLAFGVMQARHAMPAEQRAPALLPLLDRFSPVAYVAVGVLALSGLYSAVHHLDAPSMLSSTVYGQILVVKSGLVGLLMALSASHVLWLRPRIAHAQYRAALADHAGAGTAEVARVHEGLATLASRLRVEAWVGAGILLATALMSQTLPTDAASHGATTSTPAIPASISGAATTGDLRGQLTIAPPRLGSAAFTVRLWEKGRPVTEDDGAAIIHLSPAAQPAMRAVLTPRAHGNLFSAQASVAMAGAWHADVLVRTATVDDYRTLSFTFTVGSGARFVSPHAQLIPPHKAMARHAAHDMSGM